jgi:ATP-dependent DNA ligase
MAMLPPSPQLLSRASEPPNGDAWVHEIKYDGYRLLARVDRGRASLFSRPGTDWTSRLATIAHAVAALDTQSAVLDGELVYLAEDGRPDFDRLQQATRSAPGTAPLYYQIFDALNIDGNGGLAHEHRPSVPRSMRRAPACHVPACRSASAGNQELSSATAAAAIGL